MLDDIFKGVVIGVLFLFAIVAVINSNKIDTIYDLTKEMYIEQMEQEQIENRNLNIH